MGSEWRDVEHREVRWNATTEENEIITEIWGHDMRLMYIYNFTSATFELLYGFDYSSYPLDYYDPDVFHQEYWYLEPVENAKVNIYELNETLSKTYTNDGIISVEFVGHFTDQAPKGALIQFNDMVRSLDGFHYGINAGDGPMYPMTWNDYNDAREVAVESPVTIANLLKHDGSDVYGYFFPADPGTPFEVEGRLQGGSDLATDIDGALFSMKSYDSVWTEDSYSYTDMYYEILVNSDHTVSFTAYNYTGMENRTFGWHWEDQMVNTDGYWTTERVWVEGWYYEWFYFNQKTDEWISQDDWHYYGLQSEYTKTDVVFAEVSDINTHTLDGDLYYSFMVNLTESVREISHWWDFSFANNTWVEDPGSGVGFHDVAIWRPGWVHTFDYSGEDVYVDVTSKIGVFNSSIPGAADWLTVEERPYITIDGVDYPIVVKELMYPYSTVPEKKILFNDNDGYYYELLNGTKVYIQEHRFAEIYNVTVPGYGSFLSTQKEYQHWHIDDTTWYSWWDIYGNLHQGQDHMMWSSNVIVEFVDSSDAVPARKYVRYGDSGIMFVRDWSVPDPRTGSEYVLAENGTRYDMVHDPYDGYMYMDIGGVNYRVSYVFESMNATYLGADAFVADWWVLRELWSTVEGNYEMPYPGADADHSGVHETTAVPWGKVPTTKTISVTDTTYFLDGTPDTGMWHESDPFNHTGFWVYIDSTNYSLDGRKMWHADVNGTSVWQPMTVGGTVEYGYFDGMVFNAEDSFQVDQPFSYVNSLYNSSYMFEHDWTVTLSNGTTFSCEKRHLFKLYLVDANGTLIYTYDRMPQEEFLGNETYVYYVEDLVGVRHYVDSYYELPALDIAIASGYDVWYANGSATFNYFVNGTEYIEPYTGGHFGIEAYLITNGTLSGKYFHRWPEMGHDNAIYEVVYKGTAYNATARRDYVYQVYTVEGQAYKYALAPIQSVTFKNFDELVVGTPQWALWGVQNWRESEINNALDLDGDMTTTDDQYYVMSEYQSTNSYRTDWTRMWVNIMWDPNGTIPGDEMNTHSWMGVETNSWSYTWQETFYWFHADDLTPVGSAEWDNINSTIFDDDGFPNAGYWDIAHIARNITWEDILAEAQANGWDWISQDEQTWTWLSFGVGQHYGVDAHDGYSSINLRYEYSGLMIWEDTNNNSIMEAYLTNPGDGELTHYFIPDSVGSVSFVTPGEDYGVYTASGDMLLGLEDEVNWGVTFHDVNGTTFPFNTYAYWDWYGGVVTGSDLRTFDERPTKVTIDEITFLVHFQGFINTTEGATSNYAMIKVDNTVGQWGVDMVGGTANLEGRSLALNYLADISTSEFRTTNSSVTQEETVVSDSFEIGDMSTRFAEMIIGGVTYEWAADPYTAYNVSSQTTPFSTFTSAYQSDSGQSATSWSFTSTQYYVSIGFPQWDGYFVYQDPIFVGYISNTGDSGDQVQFSSLGISPEVPSSTDSVTIGVDITTTEMIYNVELYYSTDGYNFDSFIPMWSDSPDHWVGDIPPHAEETQIWYKVVVHTDSGMYESGVNSYIVGQGSVTTTPFPTTTTTTTDTGRPTYPGVRQLSVEELFMIGGLGLIVVVLGVMAKRRR
jgi:hypothetical protein